MKKRKEPIVGSKTQKLFSLVLTLIIAGLIGYVGYLLHESIENKIPYAIVGSFSITFLIFMGLNILIKFKVSNNSFQSKQAKSSYSTYNEDLPHSITLPPEPKPLPEKSTKSTNVDFESILEKEYKNTQSEKNPFTRSDQLETTKKITNNSPFETKEKTEKLL